MTALLDTPTPDAPPARKPRSGGPRTQAGKDASKRNALKHGMRSEVVFPEDLAAVIAERTGQYNALFQPVGPYEEWLIGQVALNSALIDRCADLIMATDQHLARRAKLCWDQDRSHAAAELGSKISKDPARVVAGLQRTLHGTVWLIQRWEGLRDALRVNGGWDDDQCALAFDLRGTPHALRSACPELSPEADLATLTALVEDELEGLNATITEGLEEIDFHQWNMAKMGLPVEDDPQTARLHRYEARYNRSFHWALKEFRRVHAAATDPAEALDDEMDLPWLSSSRPPIGSFAPESAPAPAETDRRPVVEDQTEASVPARNAALAALVAQVAQTVEPAPTPAAEPTEPPPLCRRARREKEKQARLAAKRAAKRARQAR
jgi:hypothetical protein